MVSCRHASRYSDGPTFTKYARIAVSCISLGFKLNGLLNSELSPEDVVCLDDFVFLRAKLASPLGQKEEDLIGYRSTNMEDVGTHELLIAEADSLLTLADEQYEVHYLFIIIT